MEMKRIKKTIVGVTAISILIMTFDTAGAEQITVGSESTLMVNGTSYSLVSVLPDSSGLMWEPDGKGGFQACGCRMSAFRALQAVGNYAGINNTFSTSSVAVVTGWNTDGPEELFVGELGWGEGTGAGNFSYVNPITDTKYLTLDDSWYVFTIAGISYKVTLDEYNYRFDHDKNRPGYHPDWDFFDYRTHAKTTQGNTDEKDYMKNIIKPQLIDNLKGETRFEVNPVPIPGAALLLGYGLLTIVGIRIKEIK